MLEVSEDLFRQIVSQAIDSLPKDYTKNMNNVAIVVEDEPSVEQRQRLHLIDGVTLFGLYEGIPLTSRGNYNLVLPDKITIFKNPLVEDSRSISELRKNIKRTVWHEIAHHFGLDHKKIDELQKRP